MKEVQLIGRFIAIIVIALSSGIARAETEPKANDSKFFGHFRTAYLYVDVDVDGEKVAESSAVGGKLGYLTPQWQHFSAAATLYSTHELFSNENGDFFGSNGESYTILGEAYLQTAVNQTIIKVGRFEFDSPYADTDDIRIIPNTFSGISLSNTAFENTTLSLTHVNKWSGFDSEQPENFTDINAHNGFTIMGAVYEGIDNTVLQAWYYHGADFLSLFYSEAIYEIDNFSLAVQFGKQVDQTDNYSGVDGSVYGLMASYTINNFTFNAAYNDVSGSVINGFGGGPFYTSAADHTIEGVSNQNAKLVGFEYTVIDGLSLGVTNVSFDQGADETDYTAMYEVNDDITLEVIYHDMHADGKMLFAVFNYRF